MPAYGRRVKEKRNFKFFKSVFMATKIKFSVEAKTFRAFIMPFYAEITNENMSDLYLFHLLDGFFRNSEVSKISVFSARKTPAQLVVSGKQIFDMAFILQHLDSELLELYFVDYKFRSLTIIF